MMREMLTRRFKRLSESRKKAEGVEDSENGTPKKGETWDIVPDLVIIDGGKGHLGAALQVFLNLGIDDIPLSSLAKENEELFVPYMQESIVLPRNSQGLFLVQRARDEAHRFAITFHRERRSKSSVKSVLDSIEGIGPKRRGMLIRKFGSVRGVREATIEEIASVPGMTLKLATKLKEQL
jgi:excinuclease ABC subunit C